VPAANPSTAFGSTRPEAAGASSSPPRRNLAFTGIDVGPQAGLAGVLMLAGAGLLGVARKPRMLARRRRTPERGALNESDFAGE
jgi:hypothetical protein